MAEAVGLAWSFGNDLTLFFKLCLKKWLEQIKQALTIYREDIRNRLKDFNPEK